MIENLHPILGDTRTPEGRLTCSQAVECYEYLVECWHLQCLSDGEPPRRSIAHKWIQADGNYQMVPATPSSLPAAAALVAAVAAPPPAKKSRSG